MWGTTLCTPIAYWSLVMYTTTYRAQETIPLKQGPWNNYRLKKLIFKNLKPILRAVKVWTPDIGLSACISQLRDHESQ